MTGFWILLWLAGWYISVNNTYILTKWNTILVSILRHACFQKFQILVLNFFSNAIPSVFSNCRKTFTFNWDRNIVDLIQLTYCRYYIHVVDMTSNHFKSGMHLIVRTNVNISVAFDKRMSTIVSAMCNLIFTGTGGKIILLMIFYSFFLKISLRTIGQNFKRFNQS